MNMTTTHKLVIAYSSATIFICSMLVWDDPLIGMLSSGFLLGFLCNEMFGE
jgi:hypothetical protein